MSETYCYNFSSVYVYALCVHASAEFVLAITYTFVHGFQNNLAQLSSHILSFLLPLIQEGQLSVTGKSMCTKYWLTA